MVQCLKLYHTENNEKNGNEKRSKKVEVTMKIQTKDGGTVATNSVTHLTP